MINFLILLIILVMGAQFGTALTASIIVHPILRKVSRTAAIEIFKPFFEKTHKTVISLSITVTILALIVSFLSQNWWWFGTSLVMQLNGPFTLVFMMPVNNRLMEKTIDPNSKQTEQDLIKWGDLHAVRTSLNGIIFLMFIILLVFFT